MKSNFAFGFLAATVLLSATALVMGARWDDDGASRHWIPTSVFNQAGNVDTSGVHMDLTSSTWKLTHAILVQNNGSDSIYCLESATSAAAVTTASAYELDAGSSYAIDFAARYLGIKAKSGSQAYRVKATF